MSVATRFIMRFLPRAGRFWENLRGQGRDLVSHRATKRLAWLLLAVGTLPLSGCAESSKNNDAAWPLLHEGDTISFSWTPFFAQTWQDQTLTIENPSAVPRHPGFEVPASPILLATNRTWSIHGSDPFIGERPHRLLVDGDGGDLVMIDISRPAADGHMTGKVFFPSLTFNQLADGFPFLGFIPPEDGGNRAQFGYLFKERVERTGPTTLVTLDLELIGAAKGAWRFELSYSEGRPVPDTIARSLVSGGTAFDRREVFRLHSFEPGSGPQARITRSTSGAVLAAAPWHEWENDLPAGSAFEEFPHKDATALAKATPAFMAFASSSDDHIESEASFNSNLTTFNWTLTYQKPDGKRFMASVERARLPLGLPGGATDKVTRASPTEPAIRPITHPMPIRSMSDVETQARDTLATSASVSIFKVALEGSRESLYQPHQPAWTTELIWTTAIVGFESDTPGGRSSPILQISLLTDDVLRIQYALN